MDHLALDHQDLVHLSLNIMDLLIHQLLDQALEEFIQHQPLEQSIQDHIMDMDHQAMTLLSLIKHMDNIMELLLLFIILLDMDLLILNTMDLE